MRASDSHINGDGESLSHDDSESDSPSDSPTLSILRDVIADNQTMWTRTRQCQSIAIKVN